MSTAQTQDDDARRSAESPRNRKGSGWRSRLTPRRLVPGLAAAALLVAGFVVLGGPAAVEQALEDGRGSEQPWEREGYENSGVLGDVDSDGEVSQSEAAALETTERTARDVVLGKRDLPGLAATKGTDSVLVTPAGEDWWRFVTDQAYDLTMWDAPAPSADWYAVTEGRSYEPASEVLTRYSALHVVFPTPAEADEWRLANQASGAAANVFQNLRGRVLTVTPNWVTLDQEPYGAVDELAASRAEVAVGLWSVDYEQRHDNALTEVADSVGYETFWQNLGFGEATSWQATSPTPAAPWVGTLTGFRADQVDSAEAIGAVNSSLFECAEARECRMEVGISEAVNEMWVADDTGHSGGDETYRPDRFASSIPDDVALAFSYSGALRGALNTTAARNSGSIDRYDTWVSKEGTMTVQPVFRDPSTQEG